MAEKVQKQRARFVQVPVTHDRNKPGLIRLMDPPAPLPGRIAVCRTAFDARSPEALLRGEAALVVRLRNYCVVWTKEFKLVEISKGTTKRPLADGVAAMARFSDDADLADAILRGTRALFIPGADAATVKRARDLVEEAVLRALIAYEGLNGAALKAMGIPAALADRLEIERATGALGGAVRARSRREG
jgi:hypothetical protein